MEKSSHTGSEAVGMRLFVIGVVGGVAFTQGLHNLLSHPESGLAMGLGICVTGAAILGAGGMLLHGVARSRRSRS